MSGLNEYNQATNLWPDSCRQRAGPKGSADGTVAAAVGGTAKQQDLLPWKHAAA